MMDFQTALAEIRSLGGEVHGITAQEQLAADAAKEDWGLDFPMLSDPQVDIGQALHDRRILDIYVDSELAKKLMSTGKPLAGGPYQVGLYQPAVLALRQDFSVLFEWASVPSSKNLGGALGRPRAADVVAAIKAGLAGDRSLANWNKSAGPMNFCSLGCFLMLLMANGNFVRPALFLSPDGKQEITSMFCCAVAKLVAALGLFTAAARRRPVPSGVGLGLYLTFVFTSYSNLFRLLSPDFKDSVLHKRRMDR